MRFFEVLLVEHGKKLGASGHQKTFMHFELLAISKQSEVTGDALFQHAEQSRLQVLELLPLLELLRV